KGYHATFGGPHAEVFAIRNATKPVRGATLYVNLEPCNFSGKTPPCTDLIISSGIRRVVVGMNDPNPRVAGKGIRQLRRAEISVTCDVIEPECRKLNESFAKYIQKHMPFVSLKIAQTLDGKITSEKGKQTAITNNSSNKFVHQLRSRYDAVLVGAGTIDIDNPELTVRNVQGRNPVRVILDGNLQISKLSTIARRSTVRTIMYTSTQSAKKLSSKIMRLRKNGIEIYELKPTRNGLLSVRKILLHLGSLGIASVLVEGGAFTYRQFIKERLVDKLYLIIAPKIFGSGLDAFSIPVMNKLRLQIDSSWNLDGDILLEMYLQK
ncbi:MAG TPA: bifunctional diaminohydroxyphosphoribosylaminopyrimidine deaminase/5-amino-6-(5-phosphoribosylamino)uracil reductase RibD, partial [Bacteroidota bacterium]|nr:bifunctional diaminohydroxyphosphoribosylaminopyrimidine deaminase/5-amino-6-(5-phosphoribosylamino)uracil reductase RibD [Bacteroidota bacterium]